MNKQNKKICAFSFLILICSTMCCAMKESKNEKDNENWLEEDASLLKSSFYEYDSQTLVEKIAELKKIYKFYLILCNNAKVEMDELVERIKVASETNKTEIEKEFNNSFQRNKRLLDERDDILEKIKKLEKQLENKANDEDEEINARVDFQTKRFENLERQIEVSRSEINGRQNTIKKEIEKMQKNKEKNTDIVSVYSNYRNIADTINWFFKMRKMLNVTIKGKIGEIIIFTYECKKSYDELNSEEKKKTDKFIEKFEKLYDKLNCENKIDNENLTKLRNDYLNICPETIINLIKSIRGNLKSFNIVQLGHIVLDTNKLLKAVKFIEDELNCLDSSILQGSKWLKNSFLGKIRRCAVKDNSLPYAILQVEHLQKEAEELWQSRDKNKFIRNIFNFINEYENRDIIKLSIRKHINKTFDSLDFEIEDAISQIDECFDVTRKFNLLYVWSDSSIKQIDFNKKIFDVKDVKFLNEELTSINAILQKEKIDLDEKIKKDVSDLVIHLIDKLKKLMSSEEEISDEFAKVLYNITSRLFVKVSLLFKMSFGFSGGLAEYSKEIETLFNDVLKNLAEHAKIDHKNFSFGNQ